MAKRLFEYLVVDGQLKAQVQATRAELTGTFKNKRHMFEEKLVTFTPVEEGAPSKTEEQRTIETTVAEELRWIGELWTKALDNGLHVAEGNTLARADVMLDDGSTLLTGVPATALLELEKRAGEILDLLAAVPSLDSTKGYQPDVARGSGVYVARDVTKVRTRKVNKVIRLAEATPEHQEQAQLVSVDEPAGELVEREWSAMVTVAVKGKMMERAEELRRAFKAALHRANAVEVPINGGCGRAIFSFVFGADTMTAAPVKQRQRTVTKV
jgi:hypothetical protein